MRGSLPCEVCGRPVQQPKGRGAWRRAHPECRGLLGALGRLERVLDQALDPASGIDWNGPGLAELRYRLVLLSTRVPRPRDANGRFIARNGKAREEKAG